MADKGKIKNLKSKLDANRLDLSLSELSVVPSSKEINNLKKVTEIDLSRNRLQFLNDDFCLISNLTWLDLNSNGLKALPENFGNLAGLQYLDLYKNNLTNLPLSFGNLKQLRWLDIKDNPLNEQLRSEAGECLEEKQCKQAAQKVVQYIHKLQSDSERELQKRLKSEKDAENARKAADDQERKSFQREKKKQKENRKKIATHQENSKRSEMSSQRDSTSDTSEHGLWCVCKLIFYALLVSSVTLVALTTFMYVNCTRHKEILPKSRPLCQDIYLFLTTGQKSLTWDYAATATEMRSGANDAFVHAYESVRNVDVDGWKEKFLRWTSLAREHTVKFAKFAWKDGRELSASAWEVLKVWLSIIWEFTVHVVQRLFDLTVRVCQWVGELWRDVLNDYPTYWERAKYYWKNLK